MIKEINGCSHLQFHLHSINAQYLILKDKKKEHNYKPANKDRKTTVKNKVEESI